MKFNLINGILHIESENLEELKEIFKFKKLDAFEYALEEPEFFKTGIFHTTLGTAKRPFLEQNQSVPFEFLQPYYAALERFTGYNDEPFTIENPELNYLWPYNSTMTLCHTHIVTHAYINEFGYHAEGYQATNAEGWNGKTAEEYSVKIFQEYLRDKIGFTYHEPEYTTGPNGGPNYKNPNYLKRHSAKPAVESNVLLGLIFEYWLKHKASDQQREVFEDGLDCSGKVSKEPLSRLLPLKPTGFNTKKWIEFVTWDQFKEMK